MSLLALIAAILTVAAARELIGAGGETAAGRMGRRIRAGTRRPQRGIGFAAMLEGRQRRLRAAGLTARFSAAELLAAKVAAACGVAATRAARRAGGSGQARDRSSSPGCRPRRSSLPICSSRRRSGGVARGWRPRSPTRST